MRRPWRPSGLGGARGVYLRLRYKFDADLWAGSNPDINRSLPR